MSLNAAKTPSLAYFSQIKAKTLIPQVEAKSLFSQIETKVTKERRKSMASMSLSPNVGKIAPKVHSQKQALTTIGPKKSEKEEFVTSSIQPKRPCKDAEREKNEERDVLVRNRAKVMVKPGRVVASRYNQSTKSVARKRSFPENEKDEAGRVEKRRKSNVASKVKKRWEIVSGDVVLYRSNEKEKETREGHEEEKASPRDLGAAKKIPELESIAGRYYFVKDEEGKDGEGFGHALSFIEDGEEEQGMCSF